jgi:hypothetical protein
MVGGMAFSRLMAKYLFTLSLLYLLVTRRCITFRNRMRRADVETGACSGDRDEMYAE